MQGSTVKLVIADMQHVKVRHSKYSLLRTIINMWVTLWNGCSLVRFRKRYVSCIHYVNISYIMYVWKLKRSQWPLLASHRTRTKVLCSTHPTTPPSSIYWLSSAFILSPDFNGMSKRCARGSPPSDTRGVPAASSFKAKGHWLTKHPTCVFTLGEKAHVHSLVVVICYF